MWIDGVGRVRGGNLQGEAQSRKAGRRPGLFITGKWHRGDEVEATMSAVHSELGVSIRKGREWCFENKRVTCPRACMRKDESDSSTLKV